MKAFVFFFSQTLRGVLFFDAHTADSFLLFFFVHRSIDRLFFRLHYLYTEERAFNVSFVHFFTRILLLAIRRRKKNYYYSRNTLLFDPDSDDDDSDDDSNDEDQREERDVVLFRGRRKRWTVVDSRR